MPTINITDGAATEPITLDEAKAHLIVEHEVDDELIATYISAARSAAESIVGQPLVTQMWRYTLDTFPAVICLPKVPLSSVTFFGYVDVEGEPQTLPATSYAIRAEPTHANIMPAYGQVWPKTMPGFDKVTIEFTSGYGDAGVPLSIIHAIKLILGEFYLHREDSVDGTIVSKVPRSSEVLLAPFKVFAL